jgi:hypothetical protein
MTIGDWVIAVLLACVLGLLLWAELMPPPPTERDRCEANAMDYECFCLGRNK